MNRQTALNLITQILADHGVVFARTISTAPRQVLRLENDDVILDNKSFGIPVSRVSIDMIRSLEFHVGITD